MEHLHEAAQLLPPELRATARPGEPCRCDSGTHVADQPDTFVLSLALVQMLSDVLTDVARHRLTRGHHRQELRTTKPVFLGRAPPESPLRPEIRRCTPVITSSERVEVTAGTNVGLHSNEQVVVDAPGLLPLDDADRLSVPRLQDVRHERVHALLRHLRIENVLSKREREEPDLSNPVPLHHGRNVHLESERRSTRRGRKLNGFLPVAHPRAGALVTILTRKPEALSQVLLWPHSGATLPGVRVLP